VQQRLQQTAGGGVAGGNKKVTIMNPNSKQKLLDIKLGSFFCNK
jgi:hypothetical protein